MVSIFFIKPYTKLKPILIFIIALMLVTVYSGFISFPSIVKYVYGPSFPISIDQANILTSVYLATYLICQIPAGLIIDQIKAHYSIFLCAGLLLIGLIGFSLVHSFALFIIFRIIMGVAVSFSFLLTIYIAKAFFHTRYLTLLVAIAELIFSLSMAAAPYAVNFFSHFISWQSFSIVIIAVLLLICLGYIMFGLYNCQTLPAAMINQKPTEPIMTRLVDTFSCGWFWYMTIAVGIFYIHFALYTETYAPTYIQRLYGASYAYSVFLNNIAIIGYMLGCLSLGFIAQWIEIRKLFFSAIIISTIAYCSLNVFGHRLLTENLFFRYLDYFILGYFASYTILIFSLYELTSRRVLNALMGSALNMFNLVPLLFVYVYNLSFNIGVQYERLFILSSYLLAMILFIPMLFKKPASANH